MLDEGIIVTPTSAMFPPVDEWVLVFWDHMAPEKWGYSKAARLHGGWYPARLRATGKWQTEFSRSDRVHMECTPPFWSFILDPDEQSERTGA